MARALLEHSGATAANVGQALQHFIHSSPWDENRLLARYRADRLQHLESSPVPDTFVLHTVTFLKSGRSSVGVLRQAVTGASRKANCQTAIAVCHIRSNGHSPLALRLFLPTAWLNDESRVETAGVPEAFRQPRRKMEIALQLLDTVRAEGWPGQYVVADAGIAGPADFREELVKRGLTAAADAPQEIQASLTRGHETAVAEYQRMSEQLGLNHFEGRSWRGWHHHASLVLIAHACRQFQRQD